MIRFETPIPIPLIACWSALSVAIAVLTYRRMRRVIRPAYLAGLALLRIAAATLVLVCLIQPYRDRSEPDTAVFRVAVLGDCSGSMTTRDCRDHTARLDVVRLALDAGSDDSFLSRLGERYGCDTLLFTDRRHRFAGSAFSVFPGRTAIGDVLDAGLEESHAAAVGAVVLLSDGHSNSGMPVLEAAKRYKRLGIPVTCIGVGEARAPGDLRVTGPGEPLRGTKGEPTTVSAMIGSTLPAETEITVELREGDLLIDSRQMTMPAGPVSEAAVFSVTPATAGIHTYRVRIVSETPDDVPDNDVDYVAVEVRDPDVFRVLYMAAHLNWNYKFLKLMTDRNEQINLSAVIRTGEKVFARYGDAFSEDDAEESFPQDAATVNAFDAIVLDSRVSEHLTEEGSDIIRRFVEDRGGGVLWLGPVAHLGDTPRKMLPVAAVEERKFMARKYLDADAEFLFPEERAAVLVSPPGPYLPDDMPAFITDTLKRGARAGLVMQGSDVPVLSAQHYGSGRTAFLGTESTWRWHLSSATDRDRHTVFWANLLVWLSSTAKPRLDVPFDGAKLSVNDPVNLTCSVLGSDFRPAMNATVTAMLTSPGGERSERAFAASPDLPGGYTDVFTPNQAGEYSVSLHAEFPDGSSVQRDVFFLAAHSGVEAQDTTYREDVLRDLARITGGQFYHYTEIGRVNDVPLSPAVPTRTTRRYWTESWTLIALLLAAFGAEWFLRRRIGLK